jgi:two-component system, response regulator PdtaR
MLSPSNPPPLFHPSGDPGSDPARSEEPAWGQIVPSLAGKTAVVVEDEGVTQLQVKKALTRAGMKVLGVAADGAAGVQLALNTRPDVVLMDVKMPGGIDGLEATRQILAAFRTCVIVLTAYDDLREEAKQAGACGYVVKPVTFQTLIPEVKAASDKFYSA